ncbi:hypothetical protein CR511_23775 [Pseudomonas putida]|nr:hypothetical protein CR511_23775 [Pseudomonas putida]
MPLLAYGVCVECLRLIGRYGEFDPTPREALVNLHRCPAQQSPRLRYTRILTTRARRNHEKAVEQAILQVLLEVVAARGRFCEGIGVKVLTVEI